MKSGVLLSLVVLAGFAGEVVAQCTAGQVTTGTTETAVVSFSNLNNGNGRQATVAGLQLNCAANSSTNNSVVTPFFQNLSNGSTGPTPPAGCTKSGAISGWTSGPLSGNTVTFTSTTPNTNVTNIAVSGGASATTTNGSAGALQALLTNSLVCGRPGPGYPGSPGDRWQEQHRVGGALFDYKRGPGHPTDPEKQVGSYSFSGSGATSAITHTYGGSSFTWNVYLSSPPNTYSFCVGGVEHVRAFITPGASGGCASFPP